MKKHTDHDDAPKGQLKIIKDFLPPPSQLVKKVDTVRVTLEFTRPSIEYFKKEAKKAKVPYQRMVRSLIDLYVAQHTE